MPYMSRTISRRSGVHSGRLLAFLVFLGALMSAYPPEGRAQDRSHHLELGGMVGRMSGLSVKVSRSDPSTRAYDAHATFNASGYVSLSGHVLREHAVHEGPLVAFLGPGLNIGTDDSEVFLGPSAELGVFFALSRYRAFLQLVPQLHLVPELRGDVLAAAGLRLTF